MYDLTERQEQRGLTLGKHHPYVTSRSVPAVYVVDASMRVLFQRGDPSERRSECLTAGTSLPPLVEESVRRLAQAREAMFPKPDSLASAHSNSLVVRVIWLAGTGAEAMAVLVERLRIRDHLNNVRVRYGLSPRESDVLRLLVEGATNAEIGKRLHIAESTAVFHVKRMLLKMQARNRTEARLESYRLTGREPRRAACNKRGKEAVFIRASARIGPVRVGE